MEGILQHLGVVLLGQLNRPPSPLIAHLLHRTMWPWFALPCTLGYLTVTFCFAGVQDYVNLILSY